MLKTTYEYAEELINYNYQVVVNNLIVPLSHHDDKTIKKVQKALNIDFPKSYKQFLYQYGRLVFGGEEILGIDGVIDWAGKFRRDIIGITLDQRKINTDPAFPNYFLPIYELGDGEIYCLDTSHMNEDNECPVVGWYFGNIKLLYKNFGDFFLDTVKTGLSSLEREGVEINWK